MADVVVLRAIFKAQYEQVSEGATRVDQIMREASGQEYPDLVFRAKVDKSDLDAFERERKAGGSGAPAGVGSPARTPRPSTQNPERIAKTTAAAVEQVERTSQSRQNAIAAEGEAKRASIEAQGAQRRANIEGQANTRLESQQRSHLQRLIQDKERAEARLAMRPRPSLAQRGARNTELGESLNSAGNTLSMGITAPVLAGGGLALREGIKFESSFADVRKTVDGTLMQLEKIKFELRDMAAGKNPIPIDINELNAIAASAGELGIKTTEVAQFTKTMAMLGTTTNLSSEQASSSLARIDNILGTNQQSFERYGSALVALGNNGASTESEITEMSQRLAGEAKQIGLSAPQVLAFGSALSSVGVEAESGGTSISKFWKDVDGAVRAGGKSLDDVAKVAGMSGAAFKKAWQTDAAGASVAFVQGLSKISAAGGSAAKTLDDLGMKESRQQDALLRLAGAGNLLSQSLKTGESAWQQNTALATEAGKRYETTASQLQILQNRLREVAIKASEAVLPGFNKELKGFSDGIPENAQKTAAAFEALGPAGQKAALGVLAVTLAAGPTAKLIGTVTTLVGTYQKLRGAAVAASAATAVAGAAEGAGALGAGAAGVGGAAALVSNPVGWVILAAAIIAAIGLAIKFKGDYDEILARTKQLAADAKQLDGAFKRALDGAPNGKIKKQLEDLQTEAKGAKGDVEKLEAALKKAQNMEIRIKDMKLDPATKDPLLQQVRSMIASIESQLSINIKVQAQNGTGRPAAPAPRDPVNVRADHEADLKKRAAKVGIAWPTLPKKQQKNRDDTFGMMEDTHAVAEYQKRIANIEKAIVAKEKTTHDARFDTQANAALKTYSGNLAKLLEVQKAYNAARAKGYKPDDKEVSGMGKVSARVLELKDKIQSDHKTRVDKANLAKAKAKSDREDAARKAAEERAAKQKEVDEALADQRRAEVGRSIDNQLSDVNHVSGEFSSQLARVAQLAEQGAQAIGDQEEKTAKAKAQAETLREEWSGTTKAVRDAHVEMAGIEVELNKLNGLSNTLRQNFDGIADGLGDADFEKFSAFVSKVEGSLNLAGQRNALIGRANEIAGAVMPALQGRQSNLEALRNANQLAGRGPFDSSKNPNDGNIGSVLGNVSGDQILAAGKQAHEGKLPAFKQTCAWAVTKIYDTMGVEIKTQNNNWAANLVNYARKNWKQVDAKTAPAGALLAEPSPSANSGFHVTVSRGGLNRVGSNHGHLQTGKAGANALAFMPPQLMAGAVPRASAPSDAAGSSIFKENARLKQTVARLKAGKTVSEADMNLVVAQGQRLVNAKAQRAPVSTTAAPQVSPATQPAKSTPTGPYIPGYRQNGSLLDRTRLPSSFGGSMAQYRARDGESTTYRQSLEAQLREVLKAADQIKPQKDGSIRARFGKNWETVSPWEWRREGARLDASATVKTAGDNAAREVADLGRQIRMSGRENNPYLILAEEFARGEKQFLSKYGKNSQAGMTLALMKTQLQQATKELKRESQSAARAASENNGMLGAGYSPATYDRAQFATQKRLEVWNAPDIVAMTQVVERLKEEGKEHQALGLQKNINAAATERLIAVMQAYDAQQLQGVLRGHAEQMKALNDESEALQNFIKLRSQPNVPRSLAEDYAASDAAERAARDHFSPMVKSGKFTQDEADEMVRDVGASTFANAQSKRGDSQTTSLQDYNVTIQDNIGLIKEQQGLYALFNLDSPELEKEIEMLKERSRLLSGDFKDRVGRDENGGLTVPQDVQNELDKRLSAKREELDAQEKLNRLLDSRRDADAAEVQLMSMKKDAALKLAQTEKERLQIEFAHQDALKKRVNPNYEPSEREKTARQGQLDQTGKDQAADATRRSAEQAHDIFRDSIKTGLTDGIGAGLKGLSERIKEAWMNAEIEKFARKLAGLPVDENADNGNVLASVFGSRGKQKQQPKEESGSGSEEADEEGDSTATNERVAGSPNNKTASNKEEKQGKEKEKENKPSPALEGLIAQYLGKQDGGTSALDTLTGIGDPVDMPNIGSNPNAMLGAPWFAAIPTATPQPPASPQLPKSVQNLLNSGMLGSTGSMVSQISGMIAGAKGSGATNASNVVINTSSTQVTSGVTNVSGGLFGGRSGGGGGSGTKPSFEQMVSMGVGAVT